MMVIRLYEGNSQLNDDTVMDVVIDIQNIISDLKGRGIGILISDHNVRETLGVCDRGYILNQGRMLEYGTPEQIAASPVAREIYLGDKFKL